MATAFVFLGLGAYLIIFSIISLLLIIFVKNINFNKYALLTYIALAFLASILCGTTCYKELSGIAHFHNNSYTIFRAIGDFLYSFGFSLVIYNIPTVILYSVYTYKVGKSKQLLFEKFINKEKEIDK